MGESSQPRRIQRRRTKGWRMPEGAVYVGRPTKWGNPVPWREFGRDGATRMYEQLLLTGEATWHGPHGVTITLRFPHQPLSFIREMLAGRDLACWCPLDQPCHADVLLRLANEPTCLYDDELLDDLLEELEDIGV